MLVSSCSLLTTAQVCETLSLELHCGFWRFRCYCTCCVCFAANWFATLVSLTSCVSQTRERGKDLKLTARPSQQEHAVGATDPTLASKNPSTPEHHFQHRPQPPPGELPQGPRSRFTPNETTFATVPTS